jgi:hypothetical protein
MLIGARDEDGIDMQAFEELAKARDTIGGVGSFSRCFEALKHVLHSSVLRK